MFYELEEMTEKNYREYLSIDLYNLLLNNKDHKDYNTIAYILKDRGEIKHLYSLLINKH